MYKLLPWQFLSQNVYNYFVLDFYFTGFFLSFCRLMGVSFHTKQKNLIICESSALVSLIHTHTHLHTHTHTHTHTHAYTSTHEGERKGKKNQVCANRTNKHTLKHTHVYKTQKLAFSSSLLFSIAFHARTISIWHTHTRSVQVLFAAFHCQLSGEEAFFQALQQFFRQKLEGDDVAFLFSIQSSSLTFLYSTLDSSRRRRGDDGVFLIDS